MSEHWMYSDLKSSAKTNSFILLLQFYKTCLDNTMLKCWFLPSFCLQKKKKKANRFLKKKKKIRYSVIWECTFYPDRCCMLMLCVCFLSSCVFRFPISSPLLVAVKMDDAFLLVASAPSCWSPRASWTSDPAMIFYSAFSQAFNIFSFSWFFLSFVLL